ncbi:MAG: carbamoyl-phosphate synthase domain-containing protein [Smithella sp.]|nr:carbamoyl-phosphate synthase domain-containing protein [Smithella sp.]
MENYGKIGIEGIDTRALARRLRMSGAIKGIISTESKDTNLLLKKVRAYPGLVGCDLVREIIYSKQYIWKNGSPHTDKFPSRKNARKLRVVVFNCGVKYNILRLQKAMKFCI